MENYSIESPPQPSAREQRITRILLFVWLGLALIVGAILCYILSQAFRPIPVAPVLVGQLDEYAPNSVNLEFVNARFFDETANKEQETLPLQVVRDTNNNVLVFFARSTRQNEAILIPRTCIVEWDASLEQFLELCAGSRWTRTGKYVAGPAPRDLDQFPARIENGQVWIEPKLIAGAARP